MALNFPSSPTVGDEFTGGGFTWTWTGTTWSKLAPASGSNDFTLTVGTSGNTTYVLDRPYPAGSYNITFANNDTTYDVYAIAENGTLAGYTKGRNLISSADFSELSILGAASDERISFEYAGVATAPTSAGDVSVAGAYITSVATSALPNTNDSTVITGGNFAPGLEVVFTGIDSVARAAKSVTRTNSTTATAVRPDTFPASASPFSIKVTNPGVAEPTGSNRHILSSAVTSGVAPTWTTGASLSGIAPGVVGTTITLVATDADGGPVTYTLVSGTLPAGMTLNSTTGVISGTPSAEATYVFTIRATDRENFYVDRQFTVVCATPQGQQEFSSTGTFIVPAGVSSISAVAVGAGGVGRPGTYGNGVFGTGGGGGSLRYVNNISVTPGESLTVTIGAYSAATTISRNGTVLVCGAGGGDGYEGTYNIYGGSANYYGTNVGTGGDGGAGGNNIDGYSAYGTGGGGAGGYTGAGGAGASAPAGSGSNGSGGGAGGGGCGNNTGSSINKQGGRGGGVGLLGAGTSGTGGITGPNGTNGTDGSASTGGEYGGGGGGQGMSHYGPVATIPPLSGGARIIWGPSRAYPSTGTGNV